MQSPDDIIDGTTNNTNFNLILFIICIVIASISVLILVFAIRKRIKIHKGLAVNTNGNAAAISIFSPILIASIVGIILLSIGRSAENNDIDIDLKQEISLNMMFDVYACENISDLEITFEFKNNSGTILSTKIKNVGDVQRGKTYQISISLTEFNLSQLMNISGTSAEVTGGRVSYLH